MRRHREFESIILTFNNIIKVAEIVFEIKQLIWCLYSLLFNFFLALSLICFISAYFSFDKFLVIPLSTFLFFFYYRSLDFIEVNTFNLGHRFYFYVKFDFFLLFFKFGLLIAVFTRILVILDFLLRIFLILF